MSDTVTITQHLDPQRAAALDITLGQRRDASAHLPPFYHHIYFWEAQPAEKLGRDGHPKTGLGLIPDMGLPRRMWAGGRLEFSHNLLPDLETSKRTTISKLAQKTGRTGPLAFVTLQHDYVQNERLCVREFQDLVYREDPKEASSPPEPTKARRDEDTTIPRSFTTTELFRYSALTFNGHRIHYDIEYSTGVEGYPGLVVHGPLLAQYLMLQALDRFNTLTSFSFRGVSPVMHFETVEFCWAGNEAWIRGPDGRLCMTATANL